MCSRVTEFERVCGSFSLLGLIAHRINVPQSAVPLKITRITQGYSTRRLVDRLSAEILEKKVDVEGNIHVISSTALGR